MCQYSAKDGHPQTWHLVHLGSRAVGGAGLVMTEASAVAERGMISPFDAGIYSDSHVDSWRPIANFVREQGATPGMQIAHAGRKASTCTMHETCDSYVVVEYNGDAYPCDFFVAGEWRLGNINIDSWGGIARQRRRSQRYRPGFGFLDNLRAFTVTGFVSTSLISEEPS
jgi:hypothetical protein